MTTPDPTQENGAVGPSLRDRIEAIVEALELAHAEVKSWREAADAHATSIDKLTIELHHAGERIRELERINRRLRRRLKAHKKGQPQ
jgi:chromosome segregation ATPase